MGLRIKKGDRVTVISGKNKNKSGKVLRVFPVKGTAIIEGLNIVKKHIRKKSEAETGGFQEIPMPLNLSVIQLLCPNCNRGVKIKKEVSKDKNKTRVCKKCRKTI